MVKVFPLVSSKALSFPSGWPLASLVLDLILIDPDSLLELLVFGGPDLNVKSLLDATCFSLIESIYKRS